MATEVDVMSYSTRIFARFTIILAAALLLAAKPPDTWDGLLRVNARKWGAVYLLPGADFRGYTKILLDPTEVAFRKDWERQIERSRTMRVSDRDIRRALDEASTRFQAEFAKAYQNAGYQIVTAAGPDVLRIGTFIVNLDVTAPDVSQPGITRTYAYDAGEATLVVEVRDSLSGAILGRAVDRRAAGENQPYLRNRATNIADFQQLFKRWAKTSAQGLETLKSLSPINAEGLTIRR